MTTKGGKTKKNEETPEIKEEEREREEGKVFTYFPFEENDILTVCCTSRAVLVLLRNGVICSWGYQSSTLGRKLVDAKNDCFIPNSIRPTISFVDLVCGREHCLARSDDYRVYSWGRNSHGQLGLSNFPMKDDAGKEEPTEIDTFSKIKIKQIFSAGNTAFAITEIGNRVYGWGSNETGQLGIGPNNKNPEFHYSDKYPTPQKLEISEKYDGDITIFQDRKGNKTYIAEMKRPSSNLTQAHEIFKNKNLYSREIELKEEIAKLELQVSQFKKRRVAAANDSSLKSWEKDDFIKDIDMIIEKFKEKSKNLAMKSTAFNHANNTDTINSFDKQIEFFNSKEKTIAKMRREMESKESKYQNDKMKAKMSNDYTERKKQNTEKQQTCDVSELIQRVASEIKIQKHITLNEVLKNKEELKKNDEKRKRVDEYIKLFEDVKEKRKIMLTKNNEDRTVRDTETTIKKVKPEVENFELNLLKHCEKIPQSQNNPDNLLDFSLKKSNNNLSNLDSKLKSLYETVDSGNITGKTILNIFQKNILAARQNNYLMEKIIEYSKMFYNFTLEKVVQNDNPSNYNEIKEIIEKFKSQVTVDENLDLDDGMEDLEGDEEVENEGNEEEELNENEQYGNNENNEDNFEDSNFVNEEEIEEANSFDEIIENDRSQKEDDSFR